MTSGKRLLASLAASALLFSLGGCSSQGQRLDRPDDTNLELWITQRVSAADLEDCAYLPGWFGASEYLDSRYAVLGGPARVPERHVTYLVSGYPDLKDDPAVTKIEITDPAIFVYGLSLESEEEAIEGTMVGEGFAKQDETTLSFGKGNVSFRFGSDKISISALTTNKTGIIY
ncbi:MAG: hypothetical protein LKK13_04720 [Bacilli bacterium]|jgi:hypothetical protein|nr:hypothetical protein [Bacilli bacterium]